MRLWKAFPAGVWGAGPLQRLAVCSEMRQCVPPASPRCRSACGTAGAWTRSTADGCRYLQQQETLVLGVCNGWYAIHCALLLALHAMRPHLRDQVAPPCFHSPLELQVSMWCHTFRASAWVSWSSLGGAGQACTDGSAARQSITPATSHWPVATTAASSDGRWSGAKVSGDPTASDGFAAGIRASAPCEWAHASAPTERCANSLQLRSPLGPRDSHLLSEGTMLLLRITLANLRMASSMQTAQQQRAHSRSPCSTGGFAMLCQRAMQRSPGSSAGRGHWAGACRASAHQAVRQELACQQRWVALSGCGLANACMRHGVLLPLVFVAAHGAYISGHAQVVNG